jgi:hypothetical protein
MSLSRSGISQATWYLDEHAELLGPAFVSAGQPRATPNTASKKVEANAVLIVHLISLVVSVFCRLVEFQLGKSLTTRVFDRNTLTTRHSHHRDGKDR